MPCALPRSEEALRTGSVGGTGRLGAAPAAMLSTCLRGASASLGYRTWGGQGTATSPSALRSVFSC